MGSGLPKRFWPTGGISARNGDPCLLGTCWASRYWHLRPHTAHVQGPRTRVPMSPVLGWRRGPQLGRVRKSDNMPEARPSQSPSLLPAAVPELSCRDQLFRKPPDVGARPGTCMGDGEPSGQWGPLAVWPALSSTELGGPALVRKQRT